MNHTTLKLRMTGKIIACLLMTSAVIPFEFSDTAADLFAGAADKLRTGARTEDDIKRAALVLNRPFQDAMFAACEAKRAELEKQFANSEHYNLEFNCEDARRFRWIFVNPKPAKVEVVTEAAAE